MENCDLCDMPTKYLNKQMIENKCIFQTCDDCDEAIVEQAEAFAAKQESILLTKLNETGKLQ